MYNILKKTCNEIKHKKYFQYLTIFSLISFLSFSNVDSYSESSNDFSPTILDPNFEIEIIGENSCPLVKCAKYYKNGIKLDTESIFAI